MRVEAGSLVPLTAQAPGISVEQPRGADAAKRVATEFASILVQQLVREMFESVKEGEGPFGDGPGADIQRGIAETAFARSLTENGLGSLTAAIERAIGNHPKGSGASERATTEDAPTLTETVP